ncbi:AtpZ/AtpI family protein [Pedobacter sp. HDW13]|uniref:AtpZ/AtpI family protein n=1 Tax=Pedobacter sp. HDW13 TaxID=2714940 RepID=UPI0014094063|nr:AtpZ/AtpI family protein [Pedobacter sp. HDW13]QIL37958.1 AtpZ/AtpI family protein [Pedobacter sp. HDW13]
MKDNPNQRKTNKSLFRKKTSSDAPHGLPGYDYAKYSDLGIQMLVIIGGFSYGGYEIDSYFHHGTQWVTCLLALIGVAIAVYLVIRSVSRP